jgi:rhodanese-related sulfurtransferase
MYEWGQAGLATEQTAQLLIEELRDRLRATGAGRPQLIDVRPTSEFEHGHVPGAVNVSLASLEERLSEFDPHRPVAIICARGYLSSTAASLLARRGFADVSNVAGGTSAWIRAGLPVEAPSGADFN